MTNDTLTGQFADIPHLGDIGCGRVVPFSPTGKTVRVMLPQNANPADYGAMTARGPSLTDEGVIDGDTLVFRTNISDRDITSESICVVRVRSTGDMLAKKVVKVDADPNGTTVALRSSGGGYEDRFFEGHDIQMLGIVYAVQRMADRFGRLPKPEVSDLSPIDADSKRVQMRISPELRKVRLDALLKRFTKETKEEPLPF